MWFNPKETRLDRSVGGTGLLACEVKAEGRRIDRYTGKWTG